MTLSAAALLAWSCLGSAQLFRSAVAQVEDACQGSGVRPILMVPGFLGAPLFDSANGFDPEWPDFDAFGVQVGPGVRVSPSSSRSIDQLIGVLSADDAQFGRSAQSL